MTVSTFRHICATSARVLAVFAVYALLLIVTTQLGTPRAVRDLFAAEMQDQALRALPLVAVSSAGMLSFLILRSRWHGARLAFILSLTFYGVHTLLQQVELLAFPAVARRMPPGTVSAALAGGAVFAALIAPLAVVLLGKWRPDPLELGADPRRGPWTLWQWGGRLLAGACWYVIVYFSFGYFIAWRTPGLPEFYGGQDPGSFLLQIASVLEQTPWLPCFVAARGLVWVLIAVPILRMQRGGTLEASLALGLFFSLTVAVQLYFPNPFMPPHVLRAHQRELLLSNFVFGAVLGPLLAWRRSSSPPSREPARFASGEQQQAKFEG